jgi:hypothetical protein
VDHTGPTGGRKCFELGQLEEVCEELHWIRGEAEACDGNYLLAWELEDWVSTGHPCRMIPGKEQYHAPRLEFSAADLWCVERMPRMAARLR